MLQVVNVTKHFPGVRALHQVDLAVAASEVHAVIGENGAGKSTLMKILGGDLTADSGELWLDGRPLTIASPRDAQQHGIAMIHQELNLVPALSVAENIFLGREPRTAAGLLDTRRMAREARALLERLNLKVSPQRPVNRLRVGEQQLVEVAKALSLNARLLILDEPTSALSQAEIERLFGVIAALKADGVAMIYISHKFDEIFRVADRVTVLRDGEQIATLPIGETSERQLIQLMVGRSLQELFPKTDAATGPVVLQVDGLSLRAAAGGRSLDDISFSLAQGEILGVAGLMGAGRTELLETIFGVHPPARVGGTITVGGMRRRLTSPQRAIAAGLAFVSEDRKQQGLVLKLPVAQNMTLAALRRFLRFDLIRERLEAGAVREMIDQLRIKTPTPRVEVEKLSGGNQQKVILARWLLTRPRVLLLDEPTRGIDVGAKAEIYALIGQLAAGGAGIVIASSELLELLSLCDRILVLCEGRLTAVLPAATATQEAILAAATERAGPAAA